MSRHSGSTFKNNEDLTGHAVGRSSRRGITKLPPAGIPTGELVTNGIYGENRIRPQVNPASPQRGNSNPYDASPSRPYGELAYASPTRKGTLQRTARAFLNRGFEDDMANVHPDIAPTFNGNHMPANLNFEDSARQFQKSRGGTRQHMSKRDIRSREWEPYYASDAPVFPLGGYEAPLPKTPPKATRPKFWTGTSYELKSDEIPRVSAEELISKLRSGGRAAAGKNLHIGKIEMGTTAWEPTKPMEPPPRIKQETRHMKVMEGWTWGNQKTWFTGKTTFPLSGAQRKISTAPSATISRCVKSFVSDWRTSKVVGADPRSLYLTQGLRKQPTYTRVHSYLAT